MPMLERRRARHPAFESSTQCGGRTRRSARFDATLVVVQTALATMVTVATVFLIGAFVSLQRVVSGSSAAAC